MWLSASEALRRLKSKPQSLYASVSRGRVRAKPDPADQRRSLYFAEDVDRLAARAHGRRPAVAVAAEAVSWGDPVMPTAISTVRNGRLIYRGIDAGTLAKEAALEDAAALLWERQRVDLPREAVVGMPSTQSLFAELARRAAGPEGDRWTRPEDVLAVVAAALAGAGDAPLHDRLARRWTCPAAADALRRAMVLLADHELNASTFAARIAASTGASAWAGLLAGLATLSGPRHGTASREIGALVEDLGDSADAEAALRDWLGEGRRLPGFGHPLYPDGDMRATELLAAFEVPRAFRRVAAAAEVVAGEAANVDFALSALASHFALPADAPFSVFALARSVGWLAHMDEQVAQGRLIRPRAQYVGR